MIEHRRLGRSDIHTSTLGFGGGPLGWADGAHADAAAAATLIAAWNAGLRYMDTAPFYGHGQSERRIGAFLATRSRDEFVLSTKVGRLIREGRPVYDYSRDGALRSVEESLGRLGLGRIDILLVHDIDRYTHAADQPARMREALEGALPALAEMKAQGTIRGYGLGVNEWQVCADVAAHMPIDVVLLAGRYTLLEQGARGFLDQAHAAGIGVILGGPYNSGILATGAREGAFYDYRPAPKEILERTERIERVLARHGIALQAAALHFPLHHPAVATVIPGLFGEREVQRTVEAFSVRIPAECLDDLVHEGLITTTVPD